MGPSRVRVWLLLLRIRLLYSWRRVRLSWALPLEPEPDARGALPPIDTGGGFRPAFGSQFGDPSEAHTSPHSEGSNCTMAAAGMALEYQSGTRKRGGDMRHAQGDLEGGTDLYDAAEAFARNGQSLSIRSGRGWGAVVADLEAGRGIILQGTGGLAGCGDYGGGHAIYVNPERSGTRWLKGDPECSGWEWCEARDLELWAEELSPSVMYAATSAKAEVVEVAGLRVRIDEPWAGNVTMTASGASAIVVADKSLVGLPVGAVKRGYWLGELAEKYGGWAIGSPVVGIGDELAVLLLAQVQLAADPPPPSSGDDYQRGRVDEWQTWAGGLGVPPEPSP